MSRTALGGGFGWLTGGLGGGDAVLAWAKQAVELSDKAAAIAITRYMFLS
jgi:hypothetical protein